MCSKADVVHQVAQLWLLCCDLGHGVQLSTCGRSHMHVLRPLERVQVRSEPVAMAPVLVAPVALVVLAVLVVLVVLVVAVVPVA